MQGWRTLLFAAAVALVAVLQTADLVHLIPQDQSWSGAVMIAIGAVIAALRYITTGPVGQK